jgi:hypothetical protein
VTGPASPSGLSAEKRQLLARMLRSKGLAQPAQIPRRDVASPCLASFGQQRVWRQAQKPGTGALYHVVTGVRMHGALDRVALQGALDAIVARHEVLRTRFTWDGARLWQVSQPASPVALPRVDLAGLDPAARAAAVQRETLDEAAAPFALADGPLLRGRLLQLADEDHVLLVTKHRMVCDGWAKGVFGRELGALYSARHDQIASPLPALEIQYADYAQWQRQQLTPAVVQRGLDEQRQRLAGAPPVLDLPTDRPRPATRDHAGAGHAFGWDAQLTAALKHVARQHEVTLFMILLAGWAILLARRSGQRDLVIGSPMANRPQRALEGLLGTFVNLVPVRVDLRDELTGSALLQQIKATTLAAYALQWLPFDEVAAAVGPDPAVPGPGLDRHQIFQVSFMLLNTPTGAVQLSGLTLAPHEVPITAAEHELSLNLQERGDCLAGTLIYATALFDAGTIAAWLDELQDVLRALVQSPASPVRAWLHPSTRSART